MLKLKICYYKRVNDKNIHNYSLIWNGSIKDLCLKA